MMSYSDKNIKCLKNEHSPEITQTSKQKADAGIQVRKL